MDLADVSITKLPGVGSAYKTKFSKIGITTIFDILLRGSEDIHVTTGMKKDATDVLIRKAKQYLEERDLIPQEEMSATELLKFNEEAIRVKTGSPDLDKMLSGGVELGHTMSIYGGDGSGKTQFCHTVAVQTIEQTGKLVYWLEIENTFRPERILEIALALGYAKDRQDAIDKFLEKIVLKRCKDSTIMMDILDHSTDMILTENIGVIIVDGSTGKFRLDYRGRGTLSDRQVDLGTFVARLDKLAYYLRLGVIITNQVTANLDPYGAKVLPIGGYIFAHFAEYILYIKKSGEKRIVTLKKSSYIPEHSIEVQITDKGLEDLKKIEPKQQQI